MNAETLGAQLAALPRARVRAADHAAVGYDLDVALPESSLLAAVGIMDGAGYFLEGMTGVDWLGECEALRKEAEAMAKKAAEAAAVSAADATDTSQAAPPEAPVQDPISMEDELEVVYDFNLYAARHRVC